MMTRRIHTGQRMRQLTATLAVLWCMPAAGVLAADCDPGVDYLILDYFKPPRSDYAKYVFQGGFPLSLCNAPHGPIDFSQGNFTSCDDIDLKGYLFLPKRGNGPTAPFGVFEPPGMQTNAVPTTEHDLPLILFNPGSVGNEAEPNKPFPDPIHALCGQGEYFTGRGFAFFQIIRRGYHPSTGENELVREHKGFGSLDYLANDSFDVNEAMRYLIGLQNINGNPLIDRSRIAIAGHSYGAIVTLFYGALGNLQPLKDACQCAEPHLIAKAKAMLAPSSQSWDGFDREDGVLNDTSRDIELLKNAAMNSLLPAYYLEPLNDASSRPAVVLGKAAGDRFLGINQSCRAQVYDNAAPGDDSHTLQRRILDNCVLSGIPYQSSLFPAEELAPTDSSAHGPFAQNVTKWAPSVLEFFRRFWP